MAIEFRAARREEFETLVYNSRLGYGSSTGTTDVRAALAEVDFEPEWTICAFDGAEPVAQSVTYPLVIGWNGRDLACGGVAFVSTVPTYRRRGLLRELLTRACATMRDEGRPMAMLGASLAAIYHRFGFGIAFMRGTCEIDPRDLQFIDEIEAPGTVRLVRNTEALEHVRGPYARFADPRPLMIRRADPWWRSEVLHEKWRTPPLVALYEEAGVASGYVIYSISSHRETHSGPYERIEVRELIWQTPAAYQALLRFLGGYDLAYQIALTRVPADDPLPHMIQEPRLLNLRQRDGAMARLIDVAPALESRGYDADGALTFALHDRLCPWNTGSWRLVVDGSCARVTRTDAAPEMTLTARGLAMLAAGHLSASLLARLGLIEGADEQTLRTADALFATTHAPFCLDGF